MTEVRIQAMRHRGFVPQASRLGFTILVDLDMTPAQRLSNVHALLGGMSEQEAFEGMQAMFPEWFNQPAPEVRDSTWGEFQATQEAA